MSRMAHDPKQYESLPDDLPVPVDDGATDHLVGVELPALTLESHTGSSVNLSQLSGWSVLYAYPMSGRPGVELPSGWNQIPGARGCTPQACSMRDSYREFLQRGCHVYGVSTQSSEYQAELAARIHLPYPLLSDYQYRLVDALNLPTFLVDGRRLVKRLTMVIEDRIIRHVFYPVFPPDAGVQPVLDWLDSHSKIQ